MSALLAQASHRRLSDASTNCSAAAVPTPSATGCQLQGWRQCEGFRGPSGQGGRMGRGEEAAWFSCQSRGCGAVGPARRSGFLGWGRGFWRGVATSPEGRGRSCECPLRGEAPSWGHPQWLAKMRTVDTCQRCWGWEGRGSGNARGQQPGRGGAGGSPSPTLLLPCHISPPLSRMRLLPAAP